MNMMKTWKNIGLVVLTAIITIALFACGDNNNDTTTYTVTFNSNGGSAVSKITGLESGATIEKPTDPTKADNSFDGWYKDNTTFANAWNFTTDTVTANITLYAKWNCACTVKAHLGIDETCTCGGTGCDCVLQNYNTVAGQIGDIPVYRVGAKTEDTDTQMATAITMLAFMYDNFNPDRQSALCENIDSINVGSTGTEIGVSNKVLTIEYDTTRETLVPYLYTNGYLN